MLLADYFYHSPIVFPRHSVDSLESFCAWTHSEYFPEEGRVSYVEGKVIIEMSPESAETHNFIKSEIDYIIEGINRQLNLGLHFVDGMRVVNTPASLSCEPDASFVTWQSLADGQLVLKKNAAQSITELLGAPDWVLEVVSPSSIQKDKETLRKSYYTAGIPEYWLVDALGEEIEFTILIHDKSEYISAPASEDGWKRSSVFGRWFKLTRAHNQAGVWKYTLAMRE